MTAGLRKARVRSIHPAALSIVQHDTHQHVTIRRFTASSRILARRFSLLLKQRFFEPMFTFAQTGVDGGSTLDL